MAGPYQDLFAPKAATPYSGPAVAPPVATVLPTPTPTPVTPNPIAGGPVGPVSNPLLTTPNRQAAINAQMASLIPARNTGASIEATLGGAPRNTDMGHVTNAVSAALYKQNLDKPVDTGYLGGSPRETGLSYPTSTKQALGSGAIVPKTTQQVATKAVVTAGQTAAQIKAAQAAAIKGQQAYKASLGRGRG